MQRGRRLRAARLLARGSAALVLGGGLAGACALPASAASQPFDYRVDAFFAPGGAVTNSPPFGDDTVLLERFDRPGYRNSGGQATVYNRRGVLTFRWGPGPESCDSSSSSCTDTSSGVVQGDSGAYRNATGSFEWRQNYVYGAERDSSPNEFTGSIDFGSGAPTTTVAPLAPGRHVISATLLTGAGDAGGAGALVGDPFRSTDVALIEQRTHGRSLSGKLIVFGLDGSRLEATLRGTENAEVTAVATVTRGVGRFAGATGRLVLRAKIAPTDTLRYRVTGALVMPPQVRMHFTAGVAENVASDGRAEIRIGQGARRTSQGVLRFAVNGRRWSLVDYLPRGNLFASGTERVVATRTLETGVSFVTYAARGTISGGTGRYRRARGTFDFAYENTYGPRQDNQTLTYDIDADVLLGRVVRSRPPARARSQRLNVAAVVQELAGPAPPGQWLYGVPHGALPGSDAVLLSRTTGTGRHAATTVLIYDRTGMLEAHVGGFGLGRFTRGTGRYRGARGTAIYGIKAGSESVPQQLGATLNGRLRF